MNRQSSLLLRNAFRLFIKSKTLILLISILLLISLSILMTMIFSNIELNNSKNVILNNSNLAQATISIPNKYREESIKQEVENNGSTDPSGLNSQPGYTKADKELRQELDNLNVYYSMTKTMNVSDILSQNNFIVYTNEDFNNENKVNTLVIEEGNDLLDITILPNDVSLWVKRYDYFRNVRKIDDVLNSKDVYNMFQYETYMENKPWLFAQMILDYGVWNIVDESAQKCIEVVYPLTLVPQSEQEYNEKFNIFLNNEKGKKNPNSYWTLSRQQFGINGLTYTGYGFSIDARQFLKVPILGEQHVPFSINVYDPTSYFAVMSSSYMNANLESKDVLDSKTVNDIIRQKMPLKSYHTYQIIKCMMCITKTQIHMINILIF